MCSNLSSQSKHSLLQLSLLPSLVSALLLPLLSRQPSFTMISLPENFSTYNDQQKQNYIYIYISLHLTPINLNMALQRTCLSQLVLHYLLKLCVLTYLI